MATPRQFQANMRRHAGSVEANTPRIKRRVAAAILQAVVVGTPVLTGRARSNWFVGVGGPRPGTVVSYGVDGGARAISFGRAVIETVKDENIWLSNNLDYIGLLNGGSSPKAPAGFVETAIQTGVAAIRGARLL